jgi:hypothetical protein
VKIKIIKYSYQHMENLLDIEYILSITGNLHNLPVILKKTFKGNSLYATKYIKKGQTIAYYKLRAYDINGYKGPFGDKYYFTIYNKNGTINDEYIGNLYKGSLANPYRNIPFWAYFSNEPSGTEKSNAYVDANLKKNYKNRKNVNIGDVFIYKLIAYKNINPGDEILWNYGDSYIRDGYIANE